MANETGTYIMIKYVDRVTAYANHAKMKIYEINGDQSTSMEINVEWSRERGGSGRTETRTDRQ